MRCAVGFVRPVASAIVVNERAPSSTASSTSTARSSTPTPVAGAECFVTRFVAWPNVRKEIALHPPLGSLCQAAMSGEAEDQPADAGVLLRTQWWHRLGGLVVRDVVVGVHDRLLEEGIR